MHRPVQHAPLILAGLLLASCGGGSSGGSSEVPVVSGGTTGVVPTPAPTPTPAATPSPAATPTPTPSPSPTGTASTSSPADCQRVNGINYYLGSLAAPAYACQQLAGGTIQRFEVHAGDRGWSGDEANGRDRSEIVTTDLWTTQQALRYKTGADAWLSYSFMVEEGAPIASPYTIVGQMHATADDGDIQLAPEVYFQLGQTTGNTVSFTLFTRADPNAVTLVQPPAIARWKGTLTRSAWVNLVLRMRPDPYGAGQLQLWVDGKEQVNLSGIAIGYNNKIDQMYWQYGIYRQGDVTPLAVRYANMEQGTASLFARVAAPLPIAR